MTMVALNIGGATSGCGWNKDGFAAAQGAGGVVSEAQGAGAGVIDVEGAREVEGVIEKWAVAGVIDVWWGMNEVFNIVGCRP
jgi:hypothetical protein